MNMRSKRGATLLEFLIASFLIVFCAYGTLEITRILTFKNKLYTVAVDIAQQVAHQQLYLKRLYALQTREKTEAWLSDTIYKNAKSYFSVLENAVVKIGLRVNPEIVWEGAEAGVYLQLSACYSFIFAASLSDVKYADGDKPFSRLPFIPLRSEELLKPLDQRTRNCFEEISLQPTPQMQVYERAYAPWPASSQLYERGTPEGKNVIGIYPYGSPSYPPFWLPNISVHARETTQKNSRTRVEQNIDATNVVFFELL